MAVFSARGSGVTGWLLKCKTNVQLCRVSPWLEVTEGCSNVTCTQSFQGMAASAFPLRIAEEPPFKVDFVIEQWSNRCSVKEKAEGDRETEYNSPEHSRERCSLSLLIAGLFAP